MPYWVLYITLAYAPGVFDGMSLTTRSAGQYDSRAECETVGRAWSAQRSRTRLLSYECRAEAGL